MRWALGVSLFGWVVVCAAYLNQDEVFLVMIGVVYMVLLGVRHVWRKVG